MTFASMGSALPEFEIRIAFATNPAATPTWTDVTDYVESFSTRRGRQNELARPEAGSATVRLINDDRRFDPTYASGPYYGTILPMRRISIRAYWNATTFDLFHGYIESWPQAWEGTGGLAFCEIRCVDAFKVLALAEIDLSYSEELSGTRIGNVLDDVSWPAGDRSIAAGNFTIAEEAGTTDAQTGVTTYARSTALEHIQQSADGEGGLFFIDETGDAIFQDRYYRRDNSTVSQATFGDGAGEYAYLPGQAFPFDDTNLWNEARVTYRPSGEEITAGATEASFYKRTRVIGTTLAKPGEAAATASTWVWRYENPALRFPAIALDLADDGSSFLDDVLGLAVSDRVTVKRRPPGGGTISQDGYVEGIEHSVAPYGWGSALNLSPVDTEEDWWILGDATYGILGSTTKLSY